MFRRGWVGAVVSSGLIVRIAGAEKDDLPLEMRL